MISDLYLKIQTMCEKKGISISRLEIEAGLGNGTIGGWKTIKPNLGKLEAVASALGVEVSDLLKK